MRKYLYIFVFFSALILHVSESLALPPCPSDNNANWNDCFGTRIYSDGAKYVGSFKHGMRQGQGTYTAPIGSKYVGNFKDDKYHRKGTLIYADGAKYVGNFKNSMRHGKGIYTTPNGNNYAGSFRYNGFYGKGTQISSNGDKYIGEFQNWNRTGQGTLIYANGAEYVGSFKNGIRQGQGIFTSTSGEVTKGIWANDEPLYVRKVKPKKFSQPTKLPDKYDDNKIIPVASGSGFAVSTTGHVVTNNHVIDGCTYVKIHHKGKSIRSTILYRDRVNDLAVLQGEFIPSKVFKISRRNPEIMQDIFVAGYPFGSQISSTVKVTKGIVSSLSGLGNNVSNIQIDAALQPGNSGGPIFDGKGNVIGVAVAKLDLKKAVKDWGVVPENTNFGIKSNVVVNLLESNGIKIQEAGSASLSNADLGKIMSGATYHLSCWMTMAQVRKMATSKVMFQDLTQ